MAFSGNNQSLYNAALNGALAGMMSARSNTSGTTANYASWGAAATAWATKVDSLITADATLTSAGATIVPASAANQQNALAKTSMMQAICKSFWEGAGLSTDTTQADYATGAAACVAVWNQAVAQYALAPGGTSLS